MCEDYPTKHFMILDPQNAWNDIRILYSSVLPIGLFRGSKIAKCSGGYLARIPNVGSAYLAVIKKGGYQNRRNKGTDDFLAGVSLAKRVKKS